MPTIPEYDMDDSERYEEGPKTWAFHHYGWSPSAIAEMEMTGEWFEDLDAEDEDDTDNEETEE